MHDIILAPRGLGDYVMQFIGPTGTNAVEAAVWLPRPNPGGFFLRRRQVISVS